MLATGSMLWTVEDIPLLDDFPEGYRYEASEGVLEVKPPPELAHEFIAELLQDQLRAQLPAQWRVSTGLAVRTKTGFRVPDLMLRRAATRQPGTARWIPADEVALAVEVESPTGLRRDRETKRDEYAEIGIASYWRVERRPVLAVVAYALVGASYEDAARLSEGRGELHGPVPLTVDLDALRGPGRGQ